MDRWLLGVLTLFAAYGIVALAERAWQGAYRRWRVGGGRPRLSLVLVVRDVAPVIEGLVRELAALARATSDGKAGVVRVAGLLAVDLGSADDTWAILTRLGDSVAFPVATARAEGVGGVLDCAAREFGLVPTLVLPALGNAAAPLGLARALLEPDRAAWPGGPPDH